MSYQRLRVEGAAELVRKFERLSSAVQDDLLKRSIYPGAGTMAETMRVATESLKTANKNKVTRHKDGTISDIKLHLKPVEKAGLIHGLGIAPMERSGERLNTRVGYHGYNKLGKANAMIARALTKGTSFMPPDKSIMSAQNKVRTQVITQMSEQLSDEVDKIMKGAK